MLFRRFATTSPINRPASAITEMERGSGTVVAVMESTPELVVVKLVELASVNGVLPMIFALKSPVTALTDVPSVAVPETLN